MESKVTALIYDGAYSLGSAPIRWRVTMTGEQLKRFIKMLDHQMGDQPVTVKDFIELLRAAQAEGRLLSFSEIIGQGL